MSGRIMVQSTPSSGAAQKVTYARHGPIAFVTLNRPDKLNALDRDCLDLLEQHVTTAVGDPGVAAIIVSGNGRCFCAGADLTVVDDALDQGAEHFNDFLTRWHEVFGVVEAAAKPTIAAVHGFALAGGLELTQVCDFVVAGETAVLADQHAKFGLFPGGGSTQRLPRLIARRAASWMLCSGEPVDLTDALAWGLVNRVVPDDQVMAVAAEMADLLSDRSSSATAAIKQAIHRGVELQLSDALSLERRSAVQHMTSRDAAAGLAAFRSRSQPDFRTARDLDEQASAGEPAS
jgi:enoyl-CoA hydratase/carnithine racemase